MDECSLVQTGQTGRTERFAFPNVVSKKFYVWVSGLCSTFPLFLAPYGTKPPHCHPSYCLQLEPCAAMEMSAKHPSHHQRKSLLHQTLESRAAGPRSNLLKPNCKSQTILLYYYNLSQRSLLFLWKGESKNGGEKNALFQAEMTKSFICIMKKKKGGCQGVNCVWKLREQKVIKSCCILLPSPNCSRVIIRADETSDPNAHCL